MNDYQAPQLCVLVWRIETVAGVGQVAGYAIDEGDQSLGNSAETAVTMKLLSSGG